ncbi:MAG: DUF669 domain-containing protein [Proteobacteria bacterium]|nr:DUF669 domain-containing protein [Pseudomonadota bacterium]
MLLSQMGLLLKETHEFKTLVIDSLDWAERLCIENICQQRKINSISMFHQDYDFGVSLSEIPDQDLLTPIPPGEYSVVAESVALKNTKVGDGKYLNFEFLIQEGAYANRKIFQNVIVEHQSIEAKRIGCQFLKSWLIACGGSELERLNLSLIYRHLNKLCTAVIAIEEGKAGYSSRNKIQRFKKMSFNNTSDEVPF